MQRLTIILTLLVSPITIFAQLDTVFIRGNVGKYDSLYYATDTVIFPSVMQRHILAGTTVLPWTHNQQHAKGYGLWFAGVSKSDCKEDRNDFPVPDRINSVVATDSSLTIDINITDNCCYDFLCDISVDSTGTLNLIYYGYGTYCACDCCFGLTYNIAVLKFEDYDEVKAVMINGDRRTLKMINK